MAFRTLEITQPADIHIKENQLLITYDNDTVQIPLEDIIQIICHGPNIRLSTMDLTILSENKVSILTTDNKYNPSAIVLPFEGNSRQSRLMHQQVALSEEKVNAVWLQIIRQKIVNQSKVLTIIGMDGSEVVSQYIQDLDIENVDINEAMSAKEYFSFYHDGLNRRVEEPVNSRLNYGYAVIRSSIIRSLISAGFHPAFGLHHNNQLNAYNLADDLIEPFRAMVDLLAHYNISSNVLLSRTECRELSKILHYACIMDNTKVSILQAIDVMVESLKQIVTDTKSDQIKLPSVIPLEYMEGVTE